MGGRMQMVMCSGTLMLGLLLVATGGPEFAPFGWFIAVIALIGVFVPVVVTQVRRRG